MSFDAKAVNVDAMRRGYADSNWYRLQYGANALAKQARAARLVYAFIRLKERGAA